MIVMLVIQMKLVIWVKQVIEVMQVKWVIHWMQVTKVTKVMQVMQVIQPANLFANFSLALFRIRVKISQTRKHASIVNVIT